MIQFNTSLKDELRQFAIIAIPLSAAYLAEFAMFLTTKMVVGKLGYHSLAAVGIAGDLSKKNSSQQVLKFKIPDFNNPPSFCKYFIHRCLRANH